MEEFPENVRDDCLVAFFSLSSVIFSLSLLFLILFNLRIDASSSIKLEGLLLRSLLLFCLESFVLRLVLQTTGDLFNKARQVLRGLSCDSLDIALENQEITRLDQDILCL